VATDGPTVRVTAEKREGLTLADLELLVQGARELRVPRTSPVTGLVRMSGLVRKLEVSGPQASPAEAYLEGRSS
jgi:hypothetical protein